MRAGREGERDDGEQGDRDKGKGKEGDRYAALAAWTHGPTEKDDGESEDETSKYRLETEREKSGRVGEIVTNAESRQHDQEGSHGGNCYGGEQGAGGMPGLDRLEVRAEHVDQFVGLHDVCLPLAIERDSAFKPRCTFTLTADSEMPSRRAASATLRPSILTQRMERCTLSGS